MKTWSSCSFRQLMDVDTSKVHLTRWDDDDGKDKCSAMPHNNPNSDSRTTRTRIRTPCFICGYEHVNNGPLLLANNHHHHSVLLGTLFQSSSPSWIFCPVCMSTVTRLLRLTEEVEDIKARISAVVKLRRQSENAREVEERIHQDGQLAMPQLEGDDDDDYCALGEDDDLSLNFIVLKEEEEEEDPSMYVETIMSLEEEGNIPPRTNFVHSCYFCGKTFGLASTFQSHLRSHTRERLFIPPNTVPPSSCPKCGKGFAHKSSLSRHRRVAHPHSLLPSRPIKKQVCPICNKAFQSQQLYQAHSHPDLNDPTKVLYTCALCPKTYGNTKAFTKHGTKCHKSRCYFCDKEFQNLSDHFQIHTLERPWKRDENESHECHICGKTFPLRNTLAGHMRYVHGPKRKPMPILPSSSSSGSRTCPQCGKTFSRGQHLSRHMRNVHHILPTTSEMMTCPICSSVFNHRETFQAHTQPDEMDPGKVVYNCVLCSTSHCSKDSFRTHFYKFHKGP